MKDIPLLEWGFCVREALFESVCVSKTLAYLFQSVTRGAREGNVDIPFANRFLFLS